MEEWKEYKLGEVCVKIGSGATPKGGKEAYLGGDISLIRSQNVLDFAFSNDGLAYINEEQADKLKNVEVKENDVLLNITGDSVARACIVPQFVLPARVNQHVAIIRGDESLVLNKFILYLLQYKKGHLLSISQGGATRNALTKKMIENFEISLPPLPTQQKIANILSSLDDKIEVNRRINEQLEELAGALFKSWFVDFEPFKDGEFVDSELGMIPKGWKVVEVGELCDSISVKHKFDKDELIFLNTGDIHNNIYLHNNYMPINEMPGQAKKSIRKGDILYSEIRPINKHFAFVNFEANDYVVSTKLMVIRCRNINNLRLYQYLTSNEIIDFLQQEAETRSGTFPQIRFENIQRLKMIIASPIVEEQYNQNLLPIYNKIEINNEEIHHLTTLRDTLLPKLMSGEIDVNEVKI